MRIGILDVSPGSQVGTLADLPTALKRGAGGLVSGRVQLLQPRGL